MRRRLTWICLGCLVLPLMASDGASPPVVIAQAETGNTQKTDKSATESSPPNKSARSKSANVAAKTLVITPEREAAALMFVKQHHPELSELLIHLKESSPKEYERAIRDLFRASERLAQIQERDAQAYNLELSLWKARSRAQLLSAKLQMSDSEELRRSLRSTLEEEYELQLQLFRRERDRFQERVKSLDAQIERLTERRGDAISSQFQKLTKTTPVKTNQAKANAGKSNASKSNPSKSNASKVNAAKTDPANAVKANADKSNPKQQPVPAESQK